MCKSDLSILFEKTKLPLEVSLFFFCVALRHSDLLLLGSPSSSSSSSSSSPPLQYPVCLPAVLCVLLPHHASSAIGSNHAPPARRAQRGHDSPGRAGVATRTPSGSPRQFPTREAPPLPLAGAPSRTSPSNKRATCRFRTAVAMSWPSTDSPARPHVPRCDCSRSS